MNSFIRKITFDKAALSLVTITAGAVLGEAFLRTSLADAENAKQSRYPPLSKIITKGEKPCITYSISRLYHLCTSKNSQTGHMILANWTYYAHIICTHHCKHQHNVHINIQSTFVSQKRIMWQSLTIYSHQQRCNTLVIMSRYQVKRWNHHQTMTMYVKIGSYQ